MDDILDNLAERLAPFGLSLRGAFHPPENEGIGTLVLIGFFGRAVWDAFCRGRRDEPNPLDSWTRRIADPLAAEVGARALYPFEGPPFHPFQRWANAVEGLRPAPWGILIHPVYGPWHSYRAALAFPSRLPVPPPPPKVAHPCDTCTTKPCLTACPADAAPECQYDVGKCLAELDGPDRANCVRLGCAVRRACPVGREHRYDEAQLAFHIAAFRKALGQPY